jgi:ribosomal protein S17
MSTRSAPSPQTSPSEAEFSSKFTFLAEAFKIQASLFFYYIYINNYNVIRGVVLSTKMKRTIIIRRDYLHYVKKYNRFEKRHNNFAVHCSPAFPRVREGDVVTVGQCRPLSKTVRYNVLRVEAKRIEGNVRKQFVLF